MYEGVDTDPAQAEALRQYNESGAIPYRLRQPDQVARFFDGLGTRRSRASADPPVAPRPRHGQPSRGARGRRCRKKTVAPRRPEPVRYPTAARPYHCCWKGLEVRT